MSGTTYQCPDLCPETPLMKLLHPSYAILLLIPDPTSLGASQTRPSQSPTTLGTNSIVIPNAATSLCCSKSYWKNTKIVLTTVHMCIQSARYPASGIPSTPENSHLPPPWLLIHGTTTATEQHTVKQSHWLTDWRSHTHIKPCMQWQEQ